MNRLIKKFLNDFKADKRTQKGFVSVIVGNYEQIYYYKNTRITDHFFTDVAKVYKSGIAKYKEGLEFRGMGGYTYSIYVDSVCKEYIKTNWNIDGMYRRCLNLNEYLRKNDKLKHIKKFDCFCKNNNPFKIEKFYERHAIDIERAEKSGNDLTEVIKLNPSLMNLSQENKRIALMLLKKYKDDLVGFSGCINLKLLRRVIKTGLTPSDLEEMDYIDEIQEKSNHTYSLTKAKELRKYLLSQGFGCTLINIYFDYKEICEKLGEDFIEYPKDLIKRHNDLVKAWKIKKDIIKNTEIKNQYERYDASINLKHYSLIPLDSVEKLIQVGNQFHNCVGTYVDSIFNKNYLIYLVIKNNVPYACLGVRLSNLPKLDQLYLDHNAMLERREYNSIRNNLVISKRV